jgi:hypothetical protein
MHNFPVKMNLFKKKIIKTLFRSGFNQKSQFSFKNTSKSLPDLVEI